MTDIDYYKTLNLDKNATSKDIKKSYLKLVKQNHPDRGGDKNVFDDIQKGYAILICDKTRKEYDELCEQKNNMQNHHTLKEQYKQYLEKNVDNIPPNKKNQLCCDKIKKDFIDEKKWKDIVEMYEMERDQNNVEIKPLNILGDLDNFDRDKFNDLFEIAKKKTQQKKDNNKDIINIDAAQHIGEMEYGANINDVEIFYNIGEEDLGDYRPEMASSFSEKKVSDADYEKLLRERDEMDKQNIFTNINLPKNQQNNFL